MSVNTHTDYDTGRRTYSTDSCDHRHRTAEAAQKCEARRTSDRCAARVPEPPHYLHDHQCTRSAVDGGYCAQHAKIALRRRERAS